MQDELASDLLRVTFFAASLGVGYFGAVVAERRRYHGLMYAKELSRVQRFRLAALVMVMAGVCHFFGVVVGIFMAALCEAGFLELVRASVRTKLAVTYSITFILPALGACLGAGSTIASMWRQHRKQFPGSLRDA